MCVRVLVSHGTGCMSQNGKSPHQTETPGLSELPLGYMDSTILHTLFIATLPKDHETSQFDILDSITQLLGGILLGGLPTRNGSHLLPESNSSGTPWDCSGENHGLQPPCRVSRVPFSSPGDSIVYS